MDTTAETQPTTTIDMGDITQHILEQPEARLYELLHRLWMLGLDVFEDVPQALAEVAKDG